MIQRVADAEVITGSIEIDLDGEQVIQYVVLQEYIPLGQRVSSFLADAWQNGHWQSATEATTIGCKRILPVDSVQASKIREY